MFGAPRYVIKDGQVIIEDHEVRRDHEGRVLHVAPDYYPQIVEIIRPFFEDYYTIRFNNYGVDDSYLEKHEIVPTKGQQAAAAATDRADPMLPPLCSLRI